MAILFFLLLGEKLREKSVLFHPVKENQVEKHVKFFIPIWRWRWIGPWQ